MDPILAMILTFVGGGLCGSLATAGINSYKGKMQIMDCFYLEDDVLSKIPQVNEENILQQNLHFKRFKVRNTTNRDIERFKIIFQFDTSSNIVECYSSSKEGYNEQKVTRNKKNPNQAEAIVVNFNRGDEIVFHFQVANIQDNNYYVTESDCLGFKIRCYDKRVDAKHSISRQSNTVLVTKD